MITFGSKTLGKQFSNIISRRQGCTVAIAEKCFTKALVLINLEQVPSHNNHINGIQPLMWLSVVCLLTNTTGHCHAQEKPVDAVIQFICSLRFKKGLDLCCLGKNATKGHHICMLIQCETVLP